MGVRLLIGVGIALIASWVLLIAAVLVVRPRGASLRTLIGLLPDILRLLRRLAADPAIAPGVRWRLLVALAYNLQPFNLIPDFVPVLGFADNIVVTCWALRSAIHKAGPEAVERHWPGTPEELALLYRAARLGPEPVTPDRHERLRYSPSSTTDVVPGCGIKPQAARGFEANTHPWETAIVAVSLTCVDPEGQRPREP